jgi:gluconokinase
MIIILGVSGSEKSTIGRRLVEALGWPFYDGDDFHPPANIEKMATAQPGWMRSDN